ncbi:MAG: hypothetical protein ACPHCN_07205 [Mycobacterium sp.]
MAIGVTSLVGYTEMNNDDFSGTSASISGSDRCIVLMQSEGINHPVWTVTLGGQAPDNEYNAHAGNWYDPGVNVYVWWESTITSMTGSGTPTLSVARDSGNHGATFALYMFDTVDQTEKVVDSATATGAGTSISVSCSTDVESGDVLISAVNITYQTLTFTGSGTDIDTGTNSANSNGYDHGFAYQTASTTSVAETWTGSDIGAAYYGIVIREESGGGGGGGISVGQSTSRGMGRGMNRGAA